MAGQLQRTGLLHAKWDLFTRVTLEADDADTLITAQELGKGMNDGAWSTRHKTQVGPHSRIRVAFMSRDLSNQTANAFIYGFYRDGPGHRIAQLALTSGNMVMNMTGGDAGAFSKLSDPKVSSRLSALAEPQGNFRMIDTIAVTTEWDKGIVTVPATQLADYWTFVDIDLTNSPYEYLITEFQLTDMLSCVGMWVPTG